jgi:hypothetical protein
MIQSLVNGYGHQWKSSLQHMSLWGALYIQTTLAFHLCDGMSRETNLKEKEGYVDSVFEMFWSMVPCQCLRCFGLW